MTFEEVVALGPEGRGDSSWRRPYLRVGFYGAQLARYFDLFDRQQIMIRLYEDLAADPVSLLHDVIAFLDVDPSFAPDISTRHNERPYRARNAAVARRHGSTIADEIRHETSVAYRCGRPASATHHRTQPRRA